ncbi:MAG: DUF3052 domain-containing protein [Phycisphaerales bacterium JB059]
MPHPPTHGYAGTPLARKLGIKAGARVLLDAAPDALERHLGDLPEDVRFTRAMRGTRPFDLILSFNTRASRLTRRLPSLANRLETTAGLWIAWPKRTSGVETDLTDAIVRAAGLKTGLVDNKVCAIDATWSALRFVIRLKDRPARAAGR